MPKVWRKDRMRMVHQPGRTGLRRVLSALLALVLMAGMLPVLAEVTHGVVTGDKVLFRKATSGSDYWDHLDRGWIAKVLDEVTANNYKWYKVEANIPVAMNRTYVGYIRGDFFRMLTQEEETAWLVNKPQPYPPLSAATAAPVTNAPVVTTAPVVTAAPVNTPALQGDYGLVTVAGANLRETPGGTSLTALVKDQFVAVLAFPTATNPWYKVSVANEYTGFLQQDHLQVLSPTELASYLQTAAPTATHSTGSQATFSPQTPQGTLKITQTNTNLRDNPDGKSLYQYPKDTVLPFFGAPITLGGYSWLRVEDSARKLTGYIRSDCYQIVTGSVPTAAPVVTAAPTATNAPDNLPQSGTLTITKTSTNLRKEPGGTSIWQYPIGEVLSFTGAPVFAGGYTWAKVVDTRRNITGYIRSDCYQIVTGGTVTNPPVPTTPPTAGPTNASVRITLGGTNLRLAPGGTVVAVLARGRVLPFYGVPTPQGGYNWVYVYDNESKQYGYVRSDCYEFVTGAPITTPTATPATPVQPPAGTLTLTKGGVNLRNAPAGQTFAQLERGTVMNYTTFVQQAGYTWYLVDSPKGVGYVRSDVISLNTGTGPTPTTAPQATPAQGTLGYIVTIKSEINLRQRASASGAVIGIADKGLVLPLMGPIQSANGYNWFQVTVNGTAGFLRGDCVRQLSNAEVADYLNHGKMPVLTPDTGAPVETGYVLTTTTSVNVRATASVDARTLGQVANIGTAFPLLGTLTSGGRLWYKVTYQNQEGYLLGSVARMMTQAEYLSYIASQPTPAPTPAPTPVPPLSQLSLTAITNIESVIIRSAAGSTNRNLAIIYKKGTIVALQGQTANVGSETWYSVRVSGINGWIRGDLLRILTKEQEAALKATGDPDAPQAATYRTLQLGVSGEDVTRLQNELKQRGYLSAAYSAGTYDTATGDAVRAYQRANGLTVDGIAGSATQHKLYNTVPAGTYDPDGGSTVTPSLYPMELVDWYKGDINSFWGRGETAVMTDVRTGISLRIRRWAGGYHVDGEPLTSADTLALTRIYGVKNAQEIVEKNLYQRRPVWITLKGRSFAASLFGMPHNYPEGDTIANNDFNGQLCVHFYNSRLHTSGTVDREHMRAIQTAYDAAPTKK